MTCVAFTFQIYATANKSKAANLRVQHAGTIHQPEERLLAYSWSSFGHYLSAPEHRPQRMRQLARIEGKLGEHAAGELRRETAEAKGERIIAEELQPLGWRASDLATRRKNDPGKMAIAVRLRRETTLSIEAIAGRVHLGTSNTVNARLHKPMKQLMPLGSGQEGFGI